jgi:hypothetical protein
VPLPEPVPGLVIRYSYLWYSEHVRGSEEGQKDRPCAVVAAVRSERIGSPRVLVLPITHSSPKNPDHAVEIPARVKARLRLDAERSWVILSEWNEFVWPGPDLRRTVGGDETSVAYGMLPPNLFSTIRDRFLGLVRSRRSTRVPRTE